MNQEQLDKLHECSELLQETIEKFTGNSNVIVVWAAMDKENNSVASSAVAGEMTNTDLFELSFEINTRLQHIVEKQNE